MRLPSRAAIALATIVVATSGTAAEMPLWRPAANPGPLRFGTVPFDEGDARDVPQGSWEVVAAVGEFNLWSLTWHTAALHRELGRAGLPLTSGELREVERRNSGPVRHLDLEGWRGDLWVARGVGAGLTLSLHVPWLEVGRPHWDGLAERWHSLLSLGDDYRSLFPRNQSLVYLKGTSSVIERRDLDGSGVGDISVALSGRGGRWLGAEHRFVLVVRAPSGRSGVLWSSGGWDVGPRWFAAWDLGRFVLAAGVGYTWTDSSSDLLGAPRSDLWHVAGGFDWRITPSLSGFFRAHYESSPLAGFIDDRTGRPALYRRFGLVTRVAGDSWASFDIGQNSRDIGVAPDFSFHVTLGARLGSVAANGL